MKLHVLQGLQFEAEFFRNAAYENSLAGCCPVLKRIRESLLNIDTSSDGMNQWPPFW